MRPSAGAIAFHVTAASLEPRSLQKQLGLLVSRAQRKIVTDDEERPGDKQNDAREKIHESVQRLKNKPARERITWLGVVEALWVLSRNFTYALRFTFDLSSAESRPPSEDALSELSELHSSLARSSDSGRTTLQKPLGGAQRLVAVDDEADALGEAGNEESAGRGGRAAGGGGGDGSSLLLLEWSDRRLSRLAPPPSPHGWQLHKRPWSSFLSALSSPASSPSRRTCSPRAAAGGLWISKLTCTSTSSSSSLLLKVLEVPDRQEGAGGES
ncbi:hypothetical protein EYF80_049481 [Liparis tanakae]|uniref:Uncharacterized protein n=1 Tax=Liparis tanakae TaxID=230148 RepID=A0A4Z2FHW0_9TELE|nr:hypothetical protein EYF80_049481 [Liparis tanakae]